MPFFLLLPIIMAIITYVIWRKIELKNGVKNALKIFACTVTWLSIVYQFVSVAKYIDNSGTSIKEVIGEYGLLLSWTGLLLFTVYVIVLYIEAFASRK